MNGRSADQRIAQQQKALTDKLDKLKKLGINTVFFQVKPDSTALWASEILPWSDTLTGTIGEDPGYDPLQFMLDEAHKRGMKVHTGSTLTASPPTRSRRPSPRLTVPRRFIPPASTSSIQSGSAPRGIVLFSTRAFPRCGTG